MLAARAYGLTILDGVYNDIQDADGLPRRVPAGAEMGFDGKTLIHPGQVEPCNEIFAPSARRTGMAGKIVTAFKAAQAEGEEETIRGAEVCRYNQTDATRGQFLSADFKLAARALGGNTSLMRFQSTYHTYYKFERARNTVFAGNLTLGLAKLLSTRDLNGNGQTDDFDALLPISERFFSGGSTTLRGFAYEEAGPRQVVIPRGSFTTAREI